MKNNNVVIGMVILVATVILGVILGWVIFDAHPISAYPWGSFENVLLVGLLTFGILVGIITAVWVMLRPERQ